MKKILEFPENRQVYNYDCGANSVLSVLQYYGYMGREDKLMELADTDNDGTSIEGIENVLKHFKVGYETKQKMTIEEIRKHIDEGFPTIISIQAYPDDNNKDLENDIDDGHYVVAIGYDENGVIMEDPSCCYRTYLTDEELIERWHDEDEVRLGLVVFGIPKYKKDGIIPLKEYEMTARFIARELVKVAKELVGVRNQYLGIVDSRGAVHIVKVSDVVEEVHRDHFGFMNGDRFRYDDGYMEWTGEPSEESIFAAREWFESRGMKYVENVKYRKIAAGSAVFKDVSIGGLFHDGIGKGMGMDRDMVHITFYEKISKRDARVMKADWSPRQVGSVHNFGAFGRVWIVEKLPDYDTRMGHKG